MKSFKKHIIFVLLSGLFSLAMVTSNAQQDNTLFYMHKIPQSSWVNPAIISECKLHIGGIAVPVTGQILAPIHLNYSNNSLAFSDVLYYGTGDYSDSLVTPFHPNSIENGMQDEFFDNLKEHNYINLNAHINLLSAGYKWKDYYFTFSMDEKIDFRFNYSKDLVDFVVNGNGNYLGRPMNLEYGVDFRHYREYSLGVATELNDRIQIGGKLKLLFGKSNIKTRHNSTVLTVDPVKFNWHAQSEIEVSTSSPYLDILDLGYFYENDSFAFEIDTTILPDEFGSDEIKEYLFNRKNVGFGLDFGTIIKLRDKLQIHASIIDLGFIRWRQNPETVTVDGEFMFPGISIVPYLEDDINVMHDSALVDTVIRHLEPRQNNNKYTMWFNSKLYVGATYQVHKLINIGVLTRTEFYHNARMHSSITLSGNAALKNWLSVSLSYSIQHRSFANIGLGFYIRGKWFQFFMVTDNILAPFMPSKTKNINWRMGCNLAFGCNKKKDEVMF